MATGFDAQFLLKDPRRRRGDAAASRLCLPRVSRASRSALKADTSHLAATQKNNIGLIRHDGIPRCNCSDYGIIPQLPVRWAS